MVNDVFFVIKNVMREVRKVRMLCPFFIVLHIKYFVSEKVLLMLSYRSGQLPSVASTLYTVHVSMNMSHENKL